MDTPFQKPCPAAEGKQGGPVLHHLFFFFFFVMFAQLELVKRELLWWQ